MKDPSFPHPNHKEIKIVIFEDKSLPAREKIRTSIRLFTANHLFSSLIDLLLKENYADNPFILVFLLYHTMIKVEYFSVSVKNIF